MAFCGKCGAQLKDGAKFCPNCGATTEEQPGDTVNTSESAPHSEPAPDPKDVQDNKAMAVLSYISLLVLVPIFAAKESPYARYHANQGLVLLIFSIANSMLLSILAPVATLLTAILPPVGIIVGILASLPPIIGVALFVFMIIGIVHAAKGEMKELPLIGKIRILK